MENLKKIFRVTSYSREDAVNYAVKYALVPNKNYIYFGVHQRIGGDCTSFVSQCLHAGGIPYSFDKKNPWWYNGKNKEICSLSWSVAHSLYWYLIRNGEKNMHGVKGAEINNAQDLNRGDLIFYENKRGLIFHSVIVTGFRASMPLVSQHSMEALNVSYIKPYYVPKIHFVKVFV